MGAGLQRWWRDDARYVRECARFVLVARPHLHFYEMQSVAWSAYQWAINDPTLCPEMVREPFDVSLARDNRWPRQ